MKMPWITLSIVSLFLGFLAITAPAHAQATRTWVSGVGDDVNPCSRTAPCKTFAGAISKTATNGIINCIDPGGFGAVTITKSITIDCSNTQAGVLVSGTNAINVNGAGAVVYLRGLSIEGVTTGLIGVNFIQGAALTVENCKIFGFQSGTAMGINFAPSGNAELFVIDSEVSGNGAATGGGIQVRPTGAAIARVQIDRTEVLNNTIGIRIDGSTGTGARRVNILRSTASGNTLQGIVSTTTTTVNSVIVSETSASNNGSFGIHSDGAQSVILIGDNEITGNDTGITSTSGGQLISYVTNNINLNITANGTPTANQARQ